MTTSAQTRTGTSTSTWREEAGSAQGSQGRGREGRGAEWAQEGTAQVEGAWGSEVILAFGFGVGRAFT